MESFEEQQLVSTDSEPIVFFPELYIRSRSAVSRVVAGEMLVLPMTCKIGESAGSYSLNETATTIWEALEKPRSIREICDLIEHRYEISMEKPEEEDVELFVREMCSLGLVNVAIDPQKTTDLRLEADGNCG